MTEQKRYMALDFGVGHGIAVAGAFDGSNLELEVMHRFRVRHTEMLGTSYWDFPGLIIHAKKGLDAYSAKHGPELSGVACNSWGSDFGFLDKTGHLLANPVHHQDSRTEGAVERLLSIFPARSLYQRTGIHARREGTLCQLFSMAQSNSPLLDKAVTMLLIADLVSYFLSGTPVQEYTNATTTGMYDASSRDWSRDIILGSKIPPGMVPEVVAPGTVIGSLLDSVASECSLGSTPVIAPASHGTACAMAAVPALNENWVCINSGYVNHVALELAEPVITDASFSAGFGNYGGADGSIRLQKGIVGMGVLDGLVEMWSREDGVEVPVEEAFRLAEGAESLQRFVNPSDTRLFEARNTPGVIKVLLKEHGHSKSLERGEQARIFIESVVMELRRTIDKLQELSGKRIDTVHFVGRGADAPVICQSIANATGRVVKAGLVEVNAIGNIILQMMALGHVGSLSEGREVVSRSFRATEYVPCDQERWREAYGRFRETTKR